jgi:hypothetical protein
MTVNIKSRDKAELCLQKEEASADMNRSSHMQFKLPVDALKQRPAVTKLHHHLQRPTGTAHAPEHVQNGGMIQTLGEC